jgi:DNA-binding FadR family transcriptional regulator
MTTKVVELAAIHRTDEQLQRARALLSKEREEGMNPANALVLDVEFNRLLGEATGNLMYQVVSNLFTKLLHRLGPLYYNESRDFRRSLETHGQLLDALEARDPLAARNVLEQMLGYSESAIAGEIERLEAEGRIGPRTRAVPAPPRDAGGGARERGPAADPNLAVGPGGRS